MSPRDIRLQGMAKGPRGLVRGRELPPTVHAPRGLCFSPETTRAKSCGGKGNDYASVYHLKSFVFQKHFKAILTKWFLFSCSAFLGEKWGAWKYNLNLHLN